MENNQKFLLKIWGTKLKKQPKYSVEDLWDKTVENNHDFLLKICGIKLWKTNILFC